MTEARSRLLGILLLTLAACGPAATPTPTRPPVAATAVATPTTAATPAPTSAPSPTAATAPATTSPKIGGTARIPQRAEPPNFDPVWGSTTFAQTMVYWTTVLTKLFVWWSDDPSQCKFEIYPVAVKNWRWVDASTAEFTLKPSIRFQNKPPVNGREATAEDVASAFKRYQTWGSMADKSAVVDTVVVVDKYTFQMKLKQPWGDLFTDLLGDHRGPWIEPAELAKADWNQPEKNWIGSGPFMFDSYIPGVKGRLVRNPDYWMKGRPYLEAVEYPVMPDASTRLAALFSGKVNLIEDFAEEFIETTQRRISGLQVARCPGLKKNDVGMLWMNNSGPPFNDVRVRRAVAMAIDQKAIIDKLYRGKGTLIPVMPPGSPYAMDFTEFPAEVRPFLEYHPDRAKQLLAEAGYPNGFDTAINFTSRYAAPSPMVAEAVADMLNRAGIRAKVLMHEYNRYVALVLNQDPPYPVGEMALSIRSARSPEDTGAFMAFWNRAGNRNRSLVNDAEYHKLIEEFRFSNDEKRRAELARQMQIMVASNAYAARLPFTESTMTALPGVHFKWVGNVSDYGMLMETAWVE